jgi:hypothetical protein
MTQRDVYNMLYALAFVNAPTSLDEDKARRLATKVAVLGTWKVYTDPKLLLTLYKNSLPLFKDIQ